MWICAPASILDASIVSLSLLRRARVGAGAGGATECA